MLAGTRPPSLRCLQGEGVLNFFKNTNSTTRKTLSAAAMYYMTLLSPWELQTTDDITATTFIPVALKLYKENQTPVFECLCRFTAMLEGYEWVDILRSTLHLNPTPLKLPDPSFINSCRLRYLSSVSSNLSIHEDVKRLLTLFRNKNTDKWFNLDGKPNKTIGPCNIDDYMRRFHGFSNTPNRSNENDETDVFKTADALITLLQSAGATEDGVFNDNNNADQMHLNNHLQHASDSMKIIFDGVTSQVNDNNANNERSCILNKSEDEVQACWEKISKHEVIVPPLQPNNDDPTIENSNIQHESVSNKAVDIVHAFITNAEINHTANPTHNKRITLSQSNELMSCAKWLDSNREEPYYRCILGGPGTGKTWLVGELMDLCYKSYGLISLPTAYTGIAASNMWKGLFRGRTCHSVYDIAVCRKNKSQDEWPLMKPPSNSKRVALDELIAKADVIVIDEISMMDPILLAQIDRSVALLRAVEINAKKK